MLRTAIILSSITLFVTWYVHVLNRTVIGSDMRRERLRKDVAYTATVSFALFVLLSTWALVGMYVWHVRGRQVGVFTVLVPPFLIWTAFNVVAFAIGIGLAEAYCLADKRAFRWEAARYQAQAEVDAATRERPRYARVRWWPASRERLISNDL